MAPRSLKPTLDNVLLTQELHRFAMMIASRAGTCVDPMTVVASAQYQRYAKTWPTEVRVAAEIDKPRVSGAIVYVPPNLTRNIAKDVFLPIFRKRYPSLAKTRCWSADGRRVLQIGYFIDAWYA